MNVTRTTLLLWAIATVCVSVAGCGSSSSRPDEALAKADGSIEHANSGGARQYAVTDLDLAQSKLTRAKAAADKRDYDTALRLAEEAEVDAEFATARADTATAKKAALEVQAGIDALRSETTRTETQRAESPTAAPQ